MFLALIIWSVSAEVNNGVSGYLFAGVAVVIAGGLAVGGGFLLRLRVWLWGGLIGLALAPVLFGFTTGKFWVPSSVTLPSLWSPSCCRT